MFPTYIHSYLKHTLYRVHNFSYVLARLKSCIILRKTEYFMPNLKCPNCGETENNQATSNCFSCGNKLLLPSHIGFKAPKKILASDLIITNSNGTKLQNINTQSAFLFKIKPKSSNAALSNIRDINLALTYNGETA